MVRDEAGASSDRAAGMERSRRCRTGGDGGHHVGSAERGPAGHRPHAIEAVGAVGFVTAERRHCGAENRGCEHRHRAAADNSCRRGQQRSRSRSAGRCRDRCGGEHGAAAERLDRIQAPGRVVGEGGAACVIAASATHALGPILLSTLGRDPRRRQPALANRCVDRTQLARRVGRIARLLAAHSSKRTCRLG